MGKRVAVIGAGASGLTSIKCCLDEGLEPVCFEKADAVGGLWHFTEKPKCMQATIYSSTFTNTSKIFFNFSDFPYPDDWPHFLPHFKVNEYLEKYTQDFKLQPHINFNHEVQKITKAEDFKTSGAWNVKVKNELTGEVREEKFDVVMVCAGLYRKSVMPQFPGLETFRGEILHTHEYQGAEHFKGKKVVVVGFGDCAIEAASEISHFNPKVYVSTRSGNWVMSRRGPGGLPYDHFFYDRSSSFWMQFMSLSSINDRMEAFCSANLNHDLYKIKPKWRFTQTEPVINDEIGIRVLAGYIEFRPNIGKVMPTAIEFVDGSVEEDVDVIIMGTGYEAEYPFIDPSIQVMTGHKLNLYKWVFPPDLLPATLAMIGCVRSLGGFFPTCELQARWATRVFRGLVDLPSLSNMKKAVNLQHAVQDETFLSNPRHHVTTRWLNYNDDIAQQIGCKPNLATLLLSDPALAKACWYGHCVPAQYRLQGPGQWKGARDVIMNIDQQITTPFNTR